MLLLGEDVAVYREHGPTLITGVYLGSGVTSGKENKGKVGPLPSFSSMLCCILTESKSVSSPHPLAFAHCALKHCGICSQPTGSSLPVPVEETLVGRKGSKLDQSNEDSSIPGKSWRVKNTWAGDTSETSSPMLPGCRVPGSPHEPLIITC